jgi:hypothetical protein
VDAGWDSAEIAPGGVEVGGESVGLGEEAVGGMVSGWGMPLTCTVALVAAIWWRWVRSTVTDSEGSTAATAVFTEVRSAPASRKAPRSMSPEAPAEQSIQAILTGSPW